MKNILLLIGLAFISSACSDARPRPPEPFKLKSEAKTPTETEVLYQKYKVTKTNDLESKIFGKYYTDVATFRYFNQSDATDASKMAKQAIELNHFGKVVAGIGFIVGGVAGLGVGALIVSNRPKPTSSSSLNPDFQSVLDILLGVAGGVLVGGGTGWSIYHWQYCPEAKQKFDGSIDLYNRYIEGQLYIGPTPNGASGALELNY